MEKWQLERLKQLERNYFAQHIIQDSDSHRTRKTSEWNKEKSTR